MPEKVLTLYPYEYDRNCFVELWDFSDTVRDKRKRIEAVSIVASLSYGNERAKNPFKLYGYLIEKGHESVFEFVRDPLKPEIEDSMRNTLCPIRRIGADDFLKNVATLRIGAPIFTLRQMMRHRKSSYLEMSRRYVTGEKKRFVFWYPDGKKEEKVETPFGEITLEEYYGIVEQVYQSLIKKGYRPEVARSVLPVSLYSFVWVQMSYRGMLNFLVYRLEKEAQEETRLIAEKILEGLVRVQRPFVEKMVEYSYEWEGECNPIFYPARRKRAENFREAVRKFTGGE